MHSHIDYGYAWIWTSGHLLLALPAAALLLLAFLRKWSKWLQLPLAVLFLWSFSAFLIMHFVLDFNGPLISPTQGFLQSGKGRILDMGAGTGRSAIMVLQTHPQATLVALDTFSESFAEHFQTAGTSAEILQTGRQKLLANLKAAGVDQRATIHPGDMRALPFEAATFDGIVSTYAIDHLGRTGSGKALTEAFRVLKPRGEFLMMVVSKDHWLNFVWGPVMPHFGTPSGAHWTAALQGAGFQILEQGPKPASLYFLARKP